MQGIETRYMGPTNTRGSRIKATSASGISITVPYDYELDAFDNHEKAARALMKKLGWTGKIAGGSLPGNRGYAFVFAEGARDPSARHRRRATPARSKRSRRY